MNVNKETHVICRSNALIHFLSAELFVAEKENDSTSICCVTFLPIVILLFPSCDSKTSTAIN